MRRRWFFSLSVLSIVLVFALGFVLWQSAEFTSLTTVSEQITTLMPYSVAIRFMLIGIVAVFWTRLISLLASYRSFDETYRTELLALRWRVVAWLLILELMIGQNLVSHFVLAIGQLAV